MPVNLELKVPFKRTDALVRPLETIGAEYVCTMEQKDVYYKIPSGLLKLRSDNLKTELIYYNRNEKAGQRWSEYHTLQITDASAEKFLDRLFKCEIVVKKSRRLFMYGNTRIHLDKVKGLGEFVELESMVRIGKAKAEKEFKFVINSLGLPVNEEILRSYRDLLLAKQIKK